MQTKEQPIATDSSPATENGQPGIYLNGTNWAFDHTALAKSFMAQDTLAFDPNTRTFLRYEGGIWLSLSDFDLKKRLLAALTALTVERGRADLARTIRPPLLSSVVEMLRTICDSPPIATHNGYFKVANGVLDFSGETAVLKGDSAAFGFRSGCPISFDPNAKCPQFVEELLARAMSREDISLLQRYLGGCLLGGNQAQRILILEGAAASGKSTLVIILEYILGLHATATLRTEHLNGRFEFSAFQGKRVLIGKDLPTDALSVRGARTLKSLTGGERMESEFKYQNERAVIRGDFHVIISCNHTLQVALDGDVDAWRRRIIRIQFENRVTHPISNFAEKLISEEGPGILNWLVEGAMLHKQALETNVGFQLTETQVERINDMLDASRSVEAFIESAIQEAKDGQISTRDLEAAYTAFCTHKSWTPLTTRGFENTAPVAMLRRFRIHKRNDIPSSTNTAVKGYKGIALRGMADVGVLSADGSDALNSTTDPQKPAAQNEARKTLRNETTKHDDKAILDQDTGNTQAENRQALESSVNSAERLGAMTDSERTQSHGANVCVSESN